MLAATFIFLSAAIAGTLGTIHLIFTFFSNKFSPRDALLEERLKSVSPVISSQTTMWRGYIGFNASHSLGAMLFGAVYGYLALLHGAFLFQSRFLIGLGFLVLLSYLILAKRYWFRVPLRGIALALACYVVGLAFAYA